MKFNTNEILPLSANILSMLTQFLLSRGYISLSMQSFLLLIVTTLYLTLGVRTKNKGFILPQFVWFYILISGIIAK